MSLIYSCLHSLMTCHGLENVSDKKEKWCIFNQSLFLMYFSVQSLSRVQLFVASWIAACQASLSITNSQSLLKLMSIEAVMPSNDLILCCLLLLPPSIFPSIRIFSHESVLHIRWPKYWSFSFSISWASGEVPFWLVFNKDVKGSDDNDRIHPL